MTLSSETQLPSVSPPCCLHRQLCPKIDSLLQSEDGVTCFLSSRGENLFPLPWNVSPFILSGLASPGQVPTLGPEAVPRIVPRTDRIRPNRSPHLPRSWGWGRTQKTWKECRREKGSVLADSQEKPRLLLWLWRVHRAHKVRRAEWGARGARLCRHLWQHRVNLTQN